MLKTERFIARRYLFSRERRWLASAITIIAMLGVAVGVAALIVVISVMEGADHQIMGRVIDLYPHVRLKPHGEVTEERLEAAREWLLAQPEVDDVLFKLEKRTLLQNGIGSESRSTGIQLIALDEIGPINPFGIEFDESVPRDYKAPIRDKEIMIGLPLAWSLKAPYKTRLLLYANNPVMTAQGWKAKQTQVRVVQVYRTRLYDFDRVTAFVNTNTLRKLFRMPSGYDYVHVKLHDPFAADRLAKRWGEQFAQDFELSTWSSENRLIFAALSLEKLGLFVILLLAVIVAAFNIVCTMILMVNEKTQEIGVLKAIGASQGIVARTFLLCGALIGLGGTFGGVALGLGICKFLEWYKLDLPDAVYQLTHIPVHVDPMQVAGIIITAIIISLLAACLPAARAARLLPVEALRQDN